MKKVIFLVISALMVVLFSGCAGKQMEITPVFVEHKEEKFFVGTGLNIDPKKMTTTQGLAIVLKTAAQELNKKGYKYFYIEKSGFPSIITDIKSIDNYCFPENNGFHINETKKTSLESEKCKIEKKDINKKLVEYTFISLNEPSYNQITWSVKEILNDKNINKYIEAALEDGEYIDKNLKVTYSREEMRDFYKKYK